MERTHAVERSHAQAHQHTGTPALLCHRLGSQRSDIVGPCLSIRSLRFSIQFDRVRPNRARERSTESRKGAAGGGGHSLACGGWCQGCASKQIKTNSNTARMK
eukprot:7834369-Lingulodinium_polyedra.AAC.1